MTVDGEFYPLEMWERNTYENAGGVWPTPRATDGMRLRFKMESHLNTKGFQSNIVIQAIKRLGGYPTPTFASNLMGYPVGWSNCMDMVMQWYLPKRGKHLKD
jgi:hypothetical protein